MATAEKVVRVRFDGTTKGLVAATKEAQAEVRAFQRKLEDGKKAWASYGTASVQAVRSFARVSSSIASFAGAIAVATSAQNALRAGLANIAGLAPVAVAGVLSLAAALITVRLGAEGIKKAFEGLKPELDGLRSQVDAGFQKGLAPAVDDLRKTLPQLAPGFRVIATEMGGVVSRMTAWLKTQAGITAVNKILNGTATITRHVGALLEPVVTGFIRLGAAAMPALAGMSAHLDQVGQRFNAWVDRVISSGAVVEWIDRAKNGFRGLAEFMGDLKGIANTVFSALNEAGLTATGVFGGAVKAVRNFLETAEGHNALVALAKVVNQVGEAVGQVLGAALKAVGPAIPDLAAAFGRLAQQAAGVLVPAIRAIAPVLQTMASFIANNMAVIGPLVLALAGLGLAVNTVRTAMVAWTAVSNALKAVQIALTAAQWAWNAALAANPITLVIAAIAALVAAIVILWNKSAEFRDFFINIWNAIQSFVGSVASWFQARWDSVFGWLRGAVSSVGNAFSNVWNTARNIVGGVINWFQGAWNGAVNAVAGFFSGLAGRIRGAFDAVVGGIRSAINSVIRVVNGAIGGINRVTGVVGIPSIPSIPYLAKGGTARSGRPYIVGERGPELFVPGRTGRVVNANTTAEAVGGGGAKEINLTLDLGSGIRQAVQILIDGNNRATARALAMGVGAAR